MTAGQFRGRGPDGVMRPAEGDQVRRLADIDSPEVAAGQANAMVDDLGQFFYPDSPEDAAWFAEQHGARPLSDSAFPSAFTVTERTGPPPIVKAWLNRERPTR
jgi:hypothetical protein